MDNSYTSLSLLNGVSLPLTNIHLLRSDEKKNTNLENILESTLIPHFNKIIENY